MSGLWLNVVSFVNTYAALVGITNGGWKFYFLYMLIDVLGILFIYFFLVETKVSASVPYSSKVADLCDRAARWKKLRIFLQIHILSKLRLESRGLWLQRRLEASLIEGPV